MGNSTSLQASKWDDLFQALTRPDDLKAYLVRNLHPDGRTLPQSALRTQIELLTGTLQVDLALLKVNEVAESFDTATFCLGQLVSHEPQLISELSFAHTVVEGLSSRMPVRWASCPWIDFGQMDSSRWRTSWTSGRRRRSSGSTRGSSTPSAAASCSTTT